MNASDLKTAARRFGADLVGIAPIAKFAELPPERSPLAVFPQAKSMIVLGRRILRGAVSSAGQGRGSEGSFRHFGFLALEDNYLAKTTYDLCLWVEARGFEAVPMFAYDADLALAAPLATPVAPDKPAPNVQVDARLAAAFAGLGEAGRAGLFITPEFGTRQRFAMLLSDFEFEPDAEKAFGFCEGCGGACASACPLGAMPEGGGAPDIAVCRKCRNGAQQTNWGRFNTVDRVAAHCGRACLASLERRGLAASPAAAAPIAEAPAWSVNIYGETEAK